MVAPLSRKGMGKENGPAKGESVQDVGHVLPLHMLQKLARPDQIIGFFRTEWHAGKIVQDGEAWDDTVGNSLFTTIQAENVATQLLKKPRRMAFTATDVQDGLDAQFLDHPGPQMRTPG